MTIVLIDESGWIDDSGGKTGAPDDVNALVNAVAAADAVVLRSLPEKIGNRPVDFGMLRAALRRTPLYIVDGPDQCLSDGRTAAACFALTDYDRLVVTESSDTSGSAEYIIAPDTERDTLIRLAREELERVELPSFLDLSAVLATIYAGQPAWRDAPQLGSRKASKIVHMEQIQALEKAIRPTLERVGLASRPSLLDFGCGGGGCTRNACRGHAIAASTATRRHLPRRARGIPRPALSTRTLSIQPSEDSTSCCLSTCCSTALPRSGGRFTHSGASC
ncbi:hypothetical protein [Breoghania sp. L-A4]|uniref:hypothetical protein n=1 Tax=Breoghania sp. L-A4 TaxID=2304600 RepID=UPI0020BFCB44|nr:hypothetical protein [Breoghania sp. L-A4]